MRKSLICLLLFFFFYSCQNDDLKTEIESIKNELAIQKLMIEALQNGITIQEIKTDENGYTIFFSNGQSINISNGTAPLITIGENGNWYLDGKDTGKPATGENGINGQDGIDGKSPKIEIGPNGNWLINGEDTGVKALGINGTNGLNAPTITSIAEINGNYYFYFSDGFIIQIQNTGNKLIKTGKNLFNPNRVIVFNEYGFIRGDLIPINEGQLLTASSNGDMWQTTCALYDRYGIIIEDSKITILQQNIKKVTIKWRENAKYAKFEFRDPNKLNQVELGDSATNYERYVEGNENLKLISLSSIIPLLKNKNYNIFTDNIISKSYQSSSGLYIQDLPVFNDRFVVSSTDLGLISKEFRVYSGNKVDNAGTLKFEFVNPETIRKKSLNILHIGDSFTDIGTWVSDMKFKLNSLGITVNQIGTMGEANARNESLSGGTVKGFILKNGGPSVILNVEGMKTHPQAGYPESQYQDVNGIIWKVRGYDVDINGNGKLKLGIWKNPLSITYSESQNFPIAGTLTKKEGTGTEVLNYTNAEISYFNPFWNPTTNELDFEYYINKWNHPIPDVVILQFTWNDLPNFATNEECLNFSEDIKTIVEKIHDQYPLTGIIFSIEPAGALLSDQGCYFIDGSHYTRLTLNNVLNQKFNNIPYFHIAPSYAFVNRLKSFDQYTKAPNEDYPDDYVNYISDGIHCNSTGMKQIADCLVPFVIKTVGY